MCPEELLSRSSMCHMGWGLRQGQMQTPSPKSDPDSDCRVGNEQGERWGPWREKAREVKDAEEGRRVGRWGMFPIPVQVPLSTPGCKDRTGGAKVRRQSKQPSSHHSATHAQSLQTWDEVFGQPYSKEHLFCLNCVIMFLCQAKQRLAL